MPRIKTETFGGGDQSWLSSAHGIADCRTATLDVSAFTKATHYPDGYLPSGYPVAKVGGLLVPYDAAAVDTGAEVLVGHVFTDQPIDGTTDIPVPLYDHGRVKTAKVPQPGFTAPAEHNTTIVYI